MGSREALLVGLVCLIFGLGAYRGTGELGLFGGANLVLAAAALGYAGTQLARRRGARRGHAGQLVDGVLMTIAIVWAAILVEGFARTAETRFDFTYEGRYALSPATIDALERLPERVTATLYADDLDPRARRTALLLEQLELHGDVLVRRRSLEQFPDEEDFYGIRSSNSVVFDMGGRWERVDRPTEGAIFEAVSYLSHSGRDRPVVYFSTGAGEGDVESMDPVGFSGLAAALETEGIEVRLLSSPSVPRIPADAAAVVLLGPERRLHGSMQGALRGYLADGGGLVALLEPGIENGVEEILADYGLESPNGVLIDPASGSVDGEAPGLNPIASNFGEHPITRGLGSTRQTYFRGARTFFLRKPQIDDELRPAVFAGGDSWISPDVGVLGATRAPDPPNDARRDYHPIVVSGRYQRDGKETRIVAFGDRDFASNRDLRALYNLDLLMNSVQWALRREAEITIRPKASQVIQFPVPIQNSLKAFYGVGLLVPQLLVVVGGWVWLRRRGA